MHAETTQYAIWPDETYVDLEAEPNGIEEMLGGPCAMSDDFDLIDVPIHLDPDMPEFWEFVEAETVTWHFTSIPNWKRVTAWLEAAHDHL